MRPKPLRVAYRYLVAVAEVAPSAESDFWDNPQKREVRQMAETGAVSNDPAVVLDAGKLKELPKGEIRKDVAEAKRAPPIPTVTRDTQPGGDQFSTLSRFVLDTEQKLAALSRRFDLHAISRYLTTVALGAVKEFDTLGWLDSSLDLVGGKFSAAYTWHSDLPDFQEPKVPARIESVLRELRIYSLSFHIEAGDSSTEKGSFHPTNNRLVVTVSRPAIDDTDYQEVYRDIQRTLVHELTHAAQAVDGRIEGPAWHADFVKYVSDPMELEAFRREILERARQHRIPYALAVRQFVDGVSGLSPDAQRTLSEKLNR